jgi:hypothetical protein
MIEPGSDVAERHNDVRNPVGEADEVVGGCFGGGRPGASPGQPPVNR